MGDIPSCTSILQIEILEEIIKFQITNEITKKYVFLRMGFHSIRVRFSSKWYQS